MTPTKKPIPRPKKPKAAKASAARAMVRSASSSSAVPGKEARGAAIPQPPIVHRVVEVGREEELVTWNEWFARTQHAMKEIVPADKHERLQFRVTLVDGRQFLVRQLMSHVSRGLCTIGPSRWNANEAVCDVITGYLMVGVGDDHELSAISVPPTEIMTVECVLTPGEDERAPFGFYAREGLTVPSKRSEVDEREFLQAHDSYGE